MHPLTLRTSRLLLRAWQDEDLPAFAAMNDDSQVMEFFPRPLDRAESDALAAGSGTNSHYPVSGSGPSRFAGSRPSSDLSGSRCRPSRLTSRPAWTSAGDSREYWGCGFATKAAGAALEIGFHRLGLEEIVSFTVPANLRSRSVMERLGMTHSPDDDFEHPLIPHGHPLRHHVLYRMARVHDP